MRQRFDGEICGFGTTSGTRVVVGRWPVSPFGAVADAMVEDDHGHRTLIAPSAEVADFIAATYSFDAVEVAPVIADRQEHHLSVHAGALRAEVAIGRRSPLGFLLRAVPQRLATAPAWATAVDPVARRVLDGVRTRGSAGHGRREWYGAYDLHQVVGVTASWAGRDLGALAAVDPPVRFGFGSTPRRPSLARVVSTVEVS